MANRELGPMAELFTAASHAVTFGTHPADVAAGMANLVKAKLEPKTTKTQALTPKQS